MPLRQFDPSGDVVAVGVANPAAGADWSLTVPVGERWELLGATAVLTTAAGGGNRVPTFYVSVAGAGWMMIGAAANQAGGTTVIYSWGPGLVAATAADLVHATLPYPAGGRLLAGWVLRSLTSGIQAGDQWSSITFVLRKWLA